MCPELFTVPAAKWKPLMNMRATIIASLAGLCMVLVGCAGEAEPTIAELIPKKPGNYLVKHRGGGSSYLTVAKVLSDGAVLMDTGSLPAMTPPWMMRVELEKCGDIQLQFSSGAWMGLIGGGGIRVPADCPLRSLATGAEYELVGSDEG